MEPFVEGQHVLFLNLLSVIKKVNGKKYYVQYSKQLDLCAWANEESLSHVTNVVVPSSLFVRRMPHLLVVDNFYKNPDEIRQIALAQEYAPNAKSYKGKRSFDRFLLPGVREEFMRLLGCEISDWLTQKVNGVFQITGFTDPLVWHSDHQNFAAAIYLTPDAPPGAGTSFWRDRKYGCRRPPPHALEQLRFPEDTEEDTKKKHDEIYSEYNLLHPDNWELVDKVGGVYNRLVLWDAQLIHSASSYEAFVDAVSADKSRLVQLFFFTVTQ